MAQGYFENITNTSHIPEGFAWLYVFSIEYKETILLELQVSLKKLVVILFLVISSLNIYAMEEGKFYVGTHFGINSVLSQDFTQNEVLATGTRGAIDGDTGLRAAFELGYFFKEYFSMEVAFNYFDNSFTANFSDGTIADGDSYSTRIDFLNFYYHFEKLKHDIRPYVGVGLGFASDVDLELTINGTRQTFSDNNQWAYQVMVGGEKQFEENWIANVELGHVGINTNRFENEAFDNTRINSVDNYNAWSVSVGIKYLFSFSK